MSEGQTPPPPRTRRQWNAWALEQAADHLEHTVPYMLDDDAAEQERHPGNTAFLMYPGLTAPDRPTAETAAKRTARFLRARATRLLAETPDEAPEPTPEESPDPLREAARTLARRGGRKGGKARAAKLTPERRREIGRLGAQARWGPKTES